MDIEDVLQITPDEEVMRIRDGDYQKDGIWYCGRCRTPRQTDITVQGIQKRVWMLCRCEAERMVKEQEAEERRLHMQKIEKMRSASLMPGKFQEARFENYEICRENQRAFTVARRYVEKFEELEERNQGLLFYGPVGTGKSHTAACIATALMDREIPVIMTSFVKILEGYDNKEYMHLLDSARLLIIDDLGAERNTEYALEQVYNIIDSRVRVNKPMILTTNLKLRDMMETQDIRYRRIYDRIFEVCYSVEVNGPSFRIKRASERQRTMNEFFR